jgi:hypothetical protein
MHKDATKDDLAKLAAWAGRVLPPSYEWFLEFGRVACDGIRVKGCDIQSGPYHHLCLGKKEFFILSTEREMEEIAHLLLARHFSSYEMKCECACKTRHGLNTKTWHVTCTIVLFDESGDADRSFVGSASAETRGAAQPSATAVALCRALEQVAEKQRDTGKQKAA